MAKKPSDGNEPPVAMKPTGTDEKPREPTRLARAPAQRVMSRREVEEYVNRCLEAFEAGLVRDKRIQPRAE